MVSGRAAERRQNSTAVRIGGRSRTRRSGRSQGARWNIPAALGLSRSVFAGAAARGESGCDQSAREELKRRLPPPSTADKRTPRSEYLVDRAALRIVKFEFEDRQVFAHVRFGPRSG